MSPWSRMASTLHPAQLIAESSQEPPGCEHVINEMMRKGDLISRCPNLVPKYVIVGIVIRSGTDSANCIEGISAKSNRRAKRKTYPFQHVRHDSTGRHFD